MGKIVPAAAEPDEYARRINAPLPRRYGHAWDMILAIAHQTATPHQRKAIVEVQGVWRRDRRLPQVL